MADSALGSIFIFAQGAKFGPLSPHSYMSRCEIHQMQIKCCSAGQENSTQSWQEMHYALLTSSSPSLILGYLYNQSPSIKDWLGAQLHVVSETFSGDAVSLVQQHKSRIPYISFHFEEKLGMQQSHPTCSICLSSPPTV